MMKNNYDPIATRYDWLSRIVFRQNLVLSQTCLLQHIPPQSSILIVGGGTGWILSELTKTQATGLEITYIEISEKMINLAKKHNTGKNEVEFVHTAIENYTSNKTFDIILTAFLFDNFREEKV
ncbi:MAG TPA: class I SAM-dependent methyltransferase, partial [Dyadobacter sp.]|nr:class I SAM-dependent methyltransferase [Dyadobacter sp.]